MDYLLNKSVLLRQPEKSFRASIDSVLLAVVASNIYVVNADGQGGACQKIFDIGAGAGAVSLCYAHLNENVAITALEMQEFFMPYLQENIHLNHFSQKITPLCGDIFNLPAHDRGNLKNMVDVVLTNPPYLNPSKTQLSKNEIRALAMYENGWKIQQWIETSMTYLRQGGYFFLIHRSERLHDILNGFSGKIDKLSILPFHPQAHSAATRMVFIARKKGAKSQMNEGLPAIDFLPFITLHQDNGDYTDIATAILREGNMKSLPFIHKYFT